MSKSNFLWRQILTRIRIQILIGLATWIRIRIEVKSWIRIRIETNAEPPKLWLKIQKPSFSWLGPPKRESDTRFSTSGFFHESVSPRPPSIPLGPFGILSPVSTLPAINCSAVSATPANNLSPVSTTPVINPCHGEITKKLKIFRQCQRHRRKTVHRCQRHRR